MSDIKPCKNCKVHAPLQAKIKMLEKALAAIWAGEERGHVLDKSDMQGIALTALTEKGSEE